MGQLRGRTRDGSWQWLVIGVVLGLGCSGVVCLGLYALNYVRITVPGQTDASAPTIQAVLVVTATALPATATSHAEAPTQVLTTTVPNASTGLAPTDFKPVPTDNNTANTNPVSGATASSAVQVPNPTLLGTAIQLPTTAPTATPTLAPLGGGNGPGASSGNPATLAPVSAGASNNGLPPSITPTELVAVPGGIFQMGTTQREIQQAVDDCVTRDKGKCDLSMGEDSFPPHSVTVNTFRLERYDVTYDQYIAFLNYLGPKSHLNQCGGNPCAAINDPEHQGSYIKFDGTKYTVLSELYHKRPITYVTWYGAEQYCKTIGRRLPTEAEWERAARDGGTGDRIYPWGNDWDPTKARTSRPKNEGGPDDVTAYPNGVTADGIFNMAGNVSQWVNDWYESNTYKTVQPNAIDPQGPPSSSVGHKVVRGGNWDSLPFFARSVHRQDFDPLTAVGSIGFRCAADQDLSQTGGASKSTSSSGVQPTIAQPAALPTVSQPSPTVSSGTLASGNG